MVFVMGVFENVIRHDAPTKPGPVVPNHPPDQQLSGPAVCGGHPPGHVASVKENRMKVPIQAAALLMAILGLMVGASALASAIPDSHGDATYLGLLDENGVSHPDPQAMVAFAHDLLD
jgi:hypothetical protein